MKQIDVHIVSKTIDISLDGKIVKIITHFSTGRQGHLTPRFDHGQIDPKLRFASYFSHTYKDKNGKDAAMPFALFFKDGCAFHAGNPDLPSHGCIHLQMDDAHWLYDWCGHDPVGVSIKDD